MQKLFFKFFSEFFFINRDPPRAGLRKKNDIFQIKPFFFNLDKDTIKAIRNSPTISSLIYVSCDRSGLTENSIE